MSRVGLKTHRGEPGEKTEWRARPMTARVGFAAILICSIFISIFPASLKSAAAPRARNVAAQNDDGARHARPLRPGASVQRAMGGTDLHSYLIALDRGQYLRAVISQRGVDVVVTLYGPDGNNLAVVDRLRVIEGREIISSIAETSGDYRLEVRARNEKARPGTYEIEIEELHEATSEDRNRVAAERASDEAAAYAREWWLEKSLRAAVKKYEESLALVQLAKDPCGEVDALIRIGTTYIRLKQYEKAISYLDRARSVAAHKSLDLSAGDCRAGDILTALGWAYGESRDYQKALLYYDQALALASAAGDSRKQAWTLQLMGFNYFSMNEAQKALYCFSESLALTDAIEDLGMMAIVFFGMGLTYWSVGEQQKALEAYSKALPLWHTLEDHAWVTVTLDNMGLVYEAISEHRKALDCYAQTLAFRRATGQRSGEADTLTGMGRIYIAMGEARKALEHFDRALSLYEEVGNRRGVAYALRSTGDAYASIGQHRKALDHYERALPVDREMGNLGGEVKTLGGLAHAHREMGNLEEARARIESALQIIESLRARLTDEQLRASFFASKRGYYEFYIDLLMRMRERNASKEHLKAAFENSERARARSLLDLLAEAGIDIKQGVAPELKQREQNLNARLSQIQSRMIQARSQASPDKSLIAKLEEELKRAEDERQRLESDIRQKHHKYSEIHYPAPLNVEMTQELLDENTALLEYILGSDSSFLFVVSREAVHGYRLPRASEINHLVEEARQSLSQPGRRSIGRYTQAARKLYEVLIAPAAGALSGKKRLLIAPDRSLYYLPFEVLLTERPETGGRADYRALPYLLKRWAVSYIPSASVLATLRVNRAGNAQETNGTARKEFVAFGDPVYGLKGAIGSLNESKAGQIIRSMFDEKGRLELQRLADSGREVTGIARPFKPEEVALYLEERASEENVKSSPYLSNARRIHFAAHGFISERWPHYSGLVLTLGAKSKEDGLLQVYEIFNLKLNADLVVLSACRTGLGKEVRGEGIIGLTRAFMYAGTSSVVVSQWQVADRSTADMMVKFYKRMAESGDKAAALRRAKLEMMESNLYSHPYYWASFILMGEPQ